MDEVAPKVEPAAVELDVQGEISGVAVRGRVDVLDVEGRLIDFKTASRRPSCVAPAYAFQLATYQQITPGASGEVRIDSLVKTQTVLDRFLRYVQVDTQSKEDAPDFPSTSAIILL